MTLPSSLLRKLDSDTRLSTQDALDLFHHADLLTLGQYADHKNKEQNGQTVGYVVDCNINYSNICVLRCLFCAFRREKKDPDAWNLTYEEIDSKIENLIAIGGTQILMQGGHHPDYILDDYVNLLRHIKTKYPQLIIHAFSPTELYHIAHQADLSPRELLQILKEAGLDSVPGGGAEILNDKIRQQISPGKCKSADWLEVSKQAHQLQLRSSATMMFGHVETVMDRIAHMDQVRHLQDVTEGFLAFIPWTYVPGNSELGGQAASAYDYLRTLAISRLFMDNFKNIQISWLTQGMKIAQLGLSFGGNDMGSTLLEENVVRATGVSNHTHVDEVRRVISELGKVPRQRDTFFNYLN